MSGVEGVYRFLARVWRLAMQEDQEGKWQISKSLAMRDLTDKERRVLHATIKKVSEDIESLSFNTAIAQMMILVNELTIAETRPIEAIKTLLQLLNPFAPHLTEELWQQLGTAFIEFSGLACTQPWPEWDERFLAEDEIEIVVQVNGRLRDKILVKKDATKEMLERAALALPKVRQLTSDREIRKIVVVPARLINIVVDQNP
jgi:leucyl-tRNA synthetase